MNKSKVINIIIADDHEFFREGLEGVLSLRSDLNVVAHAANGDDLITKVKIHQPDLAIVDITMPVKNGIDATKIITSEFPNTKVIALSMHNDDPVIISMMKAGAMGFIDKTIKRDELYDAIDKVMYKHIRFISENINQQLLMEPGPNEGLYNSTSGLTFTERELQVLKMLIEEKTIKEMADVLYLSPKTIESHRHRIMKRMNVKSMAGMVAFAYRHHLF